MNARPILFQGAMIRALLDGRKTQTRRIVKPQPLHIGGHDEHATFEYRGGMFALNRYPSNSTMLKHCPYGQPDDLLWVRETWALVPRTAYAHSTGVMQMLRPDDDHDAAVFRAGWDRSRPSRWRPSIHMPRWASRLTLELTDVRVERVQDISADDARAEGHPKRPELSSDPVVHDEAARDWFLDLFYGINKRAPRDENPWVWCLSFTPILRNIDEVLRERAD